MEIFNDEKLMKSYFDISSFILPMVYKGYIDQIVWIRPPWGIQIDCKSIFFILILKDGKYSFNVGNNPETLEGAVDCPLSAFSAFYSKNLLNAKPVTLHVIGIDQFLKKDGYISEMRQFLNNRVILLDIDLDYFGTSSPISEVIKEYMSDEDMQDFITIISDNSTYCPNDNNTYNIVKSVIDNLWQLAYYEPSNRQFEEIIKPLIPLWCSGEENAKIYFKAFKEIIDEVEKSYPGFIKLLTFTPLPEKLPKKTEMLNMFQKMKDFLKIVRDYMFSNEANEGIPPVITISRSLNDKYTPVQTWEFVEENTYHVLKHVYIDYTPKKL